MIYYVVGHAILNKTVYFVCHSIHNLHLSGLKTQLLMVQFDGEFIVFRVRFNKQIRQDIA